MTELRPGGPVFIVGAARSGTSILYRTLLKHPSFAVDGDEGLQLAESGILDQLHRAPRWEHRKPPRLWTFFLQDDPSYDLFVEKVRDVIEGVPRPESDNHPPPWTEDVLRVFVAEATKTRSCLRLVEKTPTAIDRAEWFLDSLPNAILLYIHRHPVDVYSSFVRRGQVDVKAGASWAGLSVDEFAEMYVRQSQRARELAEAHPQRFMTVPYERFVTEPGPVTEKVCVFVGVPFLTTMVEEKTPDLTRARHDPHLYSAITTDTKTWTDYLAQGIAHQVEDGTERTLEKWGYTRYT